MLGNRPGDSEVVPTIPARTVAQTPPAQSPGVGSRLLRWLRWERVGLLGKISAALLAVGLLPLVTASFRLMQMNRDSMTEQVLRTHAVAAQTTARRLEASLGARRLVAEVSASSPVLVDDPRSEAATRMLSDLLRSPLGIAAVSVRTVEGEEVIRAQRAGLSGTVEEVLEEAPGEALRVVRHDHHSWLRLELPLVDHRGLLVALCELQPLRAELQPEELGDQAELILVDREGALIAGPEGALDRFPEEMVSVALTGRISGSGRFAEGEAAVLGAYAPVGGAPWIVLSRQSTRVAEATARRVRQRSLAAVSVAVVLVLGLTGVARQSLVTPIRGLIEAQRRLVGGVGDPAPAGGEIAQLKATFALLERRLRDQEALGEVFLGRYRVVAVVGEGAMGTVFRAWDPALKRSVAIKTVRFDRWVASERVELATRLMDEAITVARFSHPNIVGLYDVQESPEVAFLAMEYVDGLSLESHLAGRNTLTPEEVVPIALAVSRALRAAHSRGIVHRDIKPANVLLGRDRGIKVVDFGVSQVIASGATRPDALCGTPGYIPPECLKGEVHGPQGDLFALGVMMYRMLAGKLPFTGGSVDEILKNTLLTLPTPLALAVGGLPEALNELVMGLLERNPLDRHRSADEVVHALEALAGELGVGWEAELAVGETDPERCETEVRIGPDPAGSEGSTETAAPMIVDDSSSGGASP